MLALKFETCLVPDFHRPANSKSINDQEHIKWKERWKSCLMASLDIRLKVFGILHQQHSFFVVCWINIIPYMHWNCWFGYWVTKIWVAATGSKTFNMNRLSQPATFSHQAHCPEMRQKSGSHLCTTPTSTQHIPDEYNFVSISGFIWTSREVSSDGLGQGHLTGKPQLLWLVRVVWVEPKR